MKRFAIYSLHVENHFLQERSIRGCCICSSYLYVI